MNKTYLIAGGFSVASLAIGAAGGYLIAKKNFDKTLDEKIAIEVNATKKHYSILLMQKDKPDSPADIPVHDEPAVEEEPPATPDPELVKRGKAALTNYQGFAEKPGATAVVPSNIFTKDQSKPNLPPRDPATGHFLPKNATPTVAKEGPYLITEVEFLTNDPENEQDSVLYFVKAETAVLTADFTDVIPNERLGEEHLSNMLPLGQEVIYVRHDGLGVDYQVTLTEDDLTEALGLGESEADLPDDEDDDEDELAEGDLRLQH